VKGHRDKKRLAGEIVKSRTCHNLANTRSIPRYFTSRLVHQMTRPGSGTTMRLLIVRHAIAEDRRTFARTGKKDALRPLTRYGRVQMRQAARGLRRILPSIDLVGTSPLRRTVQTAEILAAAYDDPPLVSVPALDHAPDPLGFIHWLQGHRRERVIAAVGHEMHLVSLMSELLSGRHGQFVLLKKGSASLLQFEGPVRPGRAKLVWSLSPAHLRALGK
jgi:phosphohistidine phosphatase